MATSTDVSVGAGFLELTVIGARGLVYSSSNAAGPQQQQHNPFVDVEYAGQRFRTKTDIAGGNDPAFSSVFIVELQRDCHHMTLNLWDDVAGRYEFVASGRLDFQTTLRSASNDLWLPLVDQNQRSCGSLHLLLKHMPSLPQQPPQHAGQPFQTPSAPPQHHQPPSSSYTSTAAAAAAAAAGAAVGAAAGAAATASHHHPYPPQAPHAMQQNITQAAVGYPPSSYPPAGYPPAAYRPGPYPPQYPPQHPQNPYAAHPAPQYPPPYSAYPPRPPTYTYPAPYPATHSYPYSTYGSSTPTVIFTSGRSMGGFYGKRKYKYKHYRGYGPGYGYGYGYGYHKRKSFWK